MLRGVGGGLLEKCVEWLNSKAYLRGAALKKSVAPQMRWEPGSSDEVRWTIESTCEGLGLSRGVTGWQ